MFREVTLKDRDGNVIKHFPQVKAPSDWSQLSITTAATKYFTEDETSVYNMVHRITGAIFHDDEKKRHELTNILLGRRAAFNSPVWFNLGVDEEPMLSACYILDLQDDMESILETNKISGFIYKSGGGRGINWSNLRSEGESLSNGGQASGTVSFIIGFDKFGGVIKSGGKTRRSAGMDLLDIDHPDIFRFIRVKPTEEAKMKDLLATGRWGDPMDMESEAAKTVAGQNSNLTVRITDDFMAQLSVNGEWNLVSPHTGEVIETVQARDLWNEICTHAHSCGDPGIQFHDIINAHNPLEERIVASNPCLGGKTPIDLDTGQVRISSLDGKTAMIKQGDSYAEAKFFSSGVKEVVKMTVILSGGENYSLICTPDHRWNVAGHGWVETKDLIAGYSMNVAEIGETSIKFLSCEPAGSEEVFDFTVLRGSPYATVCGMVCHNCSEFMFINDSSCNLASHNLTAYIKKDELFDYDQLIADAALMFEACDRIVDLGHYPTPAIEANSKKYRPIGLGYAGLGAALMMMGLSYGEQDGRDAAAYITEVMNRTAVRTSHELFQKLGSNMSVDEQMGVWDKVPGANSLDRTDGIRNAQFTVLAPTGTIGMLMDSGTTGVEPYPALITYKHMVGGGLHKLVADAALIALESLGYNIKTAEQYILENNTLKGFVSEKDLPIFKTAMETENQLSPMEHLEMMAAVQPFLSGAISKTVNMPASATVEDVSKIYLKAWEMNLKAVAIYRDGSKSGQPLRVKSAPIEDAYNDDDESEEVEDDEWVPAVHQPLPSTRTSKTHKFSIGGVDGYMTLGFYNDGTLGELFLQVNAGSTVNGLCDSFAIAVSSALQHGVPVERLVNHFVGREFGPNGMTANSDIPMANSIIDYVFRFIASVFDPEDINEDTTNIVKPQVSFGMRCSDCGQSRMQKNGTCWMCLNCGATTGCG